VSASNKNPSELLYSSEINLDVKDLNDSIEKSPNKSIYSFGDLLYLFEIN
jgi:hypothetical protein